MLIIFVLFALASLLAQSPEAEARGCGCCCVPCVNPPLLIKLPRTCPCCCKCCCCPQCCPCCGCCGGGRRKREALRKLAGIKGLCGASCSAAVQLPSNETPKNVLRAKRSEAEATSQKPSAGKTCFSSIN